MPFLKFSRDTRGYEHVYLVHMPNRRGRPGRPRVLYWFRTPPGVKVGRRPLDDESRRALEAQNPELTFDWARLLETPFPPPEERWRERRQAERAAKQARALELEESEESSVNDAAGEEQPFAELSAGLDGVPVVSSPIDIEAADQRDDAGVLPPDSTGAVVVAPGESGPSIARRRRRRGGRRGGRRDAPSAVPAGVEPAAPSDPSPGTDGITLDDSETE